MEAHGLMVAPMVQMVIFTVVLLEKDRVQQHEHLENQVALYMQVEAEMEAQAVQAVAGMVVRVIVTLITDQMELVVVAVVEAIIGILAHLVEAESVSSAGDIKQT